MILRPVAKTTIRLKRIAQAATLSLAMIAVLVIYFNLQQPNQALANATGDYRSKTSGNWNAIGSWERYNGSSWVNATVTPNNTNGVITILNGHTITVTAGVNVDQLSVSSGATLRHNNGTLKIMDGTGTDIIVDGTLELNAQFTIDNNGSKIINGLVDKLNGGYTINPGGTVTVANGGVFRKVNGGQDTGINHYTIQNGGIYMHQDNGANLPKATWDAGSTLLIRGVTNATPGNLDQSFHHVVWDNPGQTNQRNLGANLQTVNGDFTIVSTGGGSILFGSNSNQGMSIGGNYNQQNGLVSITETGNWTVNVGGNFNVTGGVLQFTDGTSSNGSGNPDVNVTGNVNISNASVDMSQYTGSNQNAGKSRLDIKGNLTIGNGTIFRTTSTGVGRGLIAITGTTEQVYDNTITMTGPIDWDVANGAILNMGTSMLTGSGNFTLNTGGEIRIGSPQGIAASGATGNIQVTGTRTYNSGGTYTYVGLSNQVPGTGLPATITKLCMNTSAIVTMPASYTVSGTLELMAGTIDMGTNTLTVGTSTAARGTVVRINGVVYGKLRRWVNAVPGAYDFPVATSNGYKNVIINYTIAPTIGGTVTTEFIGTVPGGLGLPLMDGVLQLLNMGDKGYWNVTTGNGLVGGLFTLELTAGGFTGIGDVSGLRILTRLNSVSPWLIAGTHTNGITVGGIPVARRAGVGLVQQFGIGGGSSNPLPIDLINFTAALKNAKVKLNWNTMTETNNDFFTIERSSDGIAFESIGTVKGAGSTSQKQSYKFNDNDPLTGTSYYRLRQIDFDGKSKTFDIKVIKNTNTPVEEKMVVTSVWPNPFTDRFDMTVSSPESGKATAVIVNMSGVVVRSQVITIDSGNNQASFSDLDDLQAGYYVVSLILGNNKASQKLVKR